MPTLYRTRAPTMCFRGKRRKLSVCFEIERVAVLRFEHASPTKNTTTKRRLPYEGYGETIYRAKTLVRDVRI